MKIKKLNNMTKTIVALCLLLIVWVVDYITPQNISLAPLYATIIIFFTYWFPPRTLLILSAVVVLTQTSVNILEHISFIEWMIRTLSIVVTTFLAYQLCKQRQLLGKHLRETELAKDHLQIFLGIVTHDLAQPLTALKLYTQLLLKSADIKNNKTLYPIAGNLAKTLGRMHRMVNDLKDVARLGMGKLDIIPKKMDITQLLKILVANQQASTSKHYIRLFVPEKIIGKWDEGRLRQLFTNLLSNAIKYSPDGGNITVSIGKRKKSVLVSVADSGLGMTEAQQEQLFRPFSRLHEGQTIKGVGLGLYICKVIVEAHKGKIWVESKKNKGSTFLVELPLKPVPVMVRRVMRGERDARVSQGKAD